MSEEPRYPLHEAVRNGDLEAVRRQLADVIDIDKRDADGITALMLAAESGRADIAGLLVDGGAKVDAADNFRVTALMLAAHPGHTAVVRLLLARGANVHARNSEGRSALEVATRRDDGEVRRLLTEAGAAYGIVEAAASGDQAKVVYFLDAGESTDRHGAKGMTALIAAASNGDVELVGTLLERGADPSLRDSSGDTALHHAVRHACRTHETALLALMLDRGADINAPGRGGSPPAQDALYPESESILRFLLDHGANPEGPPDDQKYTLLYRAITMDYSNLAVIQTLLEYGADIEGEGPLGLTPLMAAVRLRPDRDNAEFQRASARIRGIPYVKRGVLDRIALVRFLVEGGANVDAANHRGSVLSHAVEFGDVALVRLLLEAGADVNEPIESSPLYRACVFGNTEVIALLRELGATGYDPDVLPENRQAIALGKQAEIRQAVARAIGAKAEAPTLMSKLAGKLNAVRGIWKRDS